MKYRIARENYTLGDAVAVLWCRMAQVTAIIEDPEMLKGCRVIASAWYDPAEQGSTEADRRAFLERLAGGAGE